MKKVILLLIALMLAVGTLSGCGSDRVQLDIYFKDANSNNLNVEKRTMKNASNASTLELAKFAVGELIKGPENDRNSAVIDKKAKLLGVAINDGVATVNMSGYYSKKSGVDELVLRFALVNTLCSVEGIDGIVIQVDGEPLISKKTGKEIGVIGINDIVLNTQEEQVSEKTTVALYFPRADGSKLEEEERTVEMQNALSLEKTVISELMKGPRSKSLSPSLPAGTKLLGIETKDNVCFVNFSGEFVSRAGSSSLATTLTLYSVVNSLCKLDSVNSVQILVNGENGVEFGNFVLDIPYEMNEELLK